MQWSTRSRVSVLGNIFRKLAFVFAVVCLADGGGNAVMTGFSQGAVPNMTIRRFFLLQNVKYWQSFSTFHLYETRIWTIGSEILNVTILLWTRQPQLTTINTAWIISTFNVPNFYYRSVTACSRGLINGSMSVMVDILHTFISTTISPIQPA